MLIAYRQCESLTRAAAGNFYYGIRLLPAPKRRAMCAVYAYARRVDDIGDGTLAPPEKLRRLDALGAMLGELSIADPDPVMAALADARERFGLPLDALEDLIAGVRMDVLGTSYASFAELELYCRRVAGSIGRLCLAIFGSRAPALAPTAAELADALGVAMQITNIVRDLREDAERGRAYLPAKDLVRYHLHDDGPLDAAALAALAREGSVAEPSVVAGFGGGDVGQLYALMRFQCLRARDWFHRGLELLELLDRRSAACVLAMAGIYLRVLRHVEEHPDRALAGRMSLTTREKAWVAARALLGKGVPERHPAERLQAED
jgi:phytoene synthase